MEQTVLYPSLSLQFLVNRYIFLHSTDAGEKISEKLIPDGLASIAFNFNGKVQITDGKNCTLVPPLFLGLPITRSLVVEVSDAPDTMVVILNASVFTKLFSFKADILPNEAFKLIEHIIPQSLFLAMKSANSNQKRIFLFEKFIESQLTTNYSLDEVDEMYLRIINQKGVEQIYLLLANYSMNHRSFRRYFNARVGLSAKSLSRIVRINNLFNCYLMNNQSDYQSLVCDCQYSDQAHLINDFKKIIGECPEIFFKHNQGQIRLISGKY